MAKDTTPPASDAETFVKNLYEMLPPQAEGCILLGHQWGVDGYFDFEPYIPDSPFPEYVTHVNASLFEPDENGDWSNAQRLVVGTLALVLDDVGTKAPPPEGVTPTAKVETSAGNEQWWFVYSERVKSNFGHGMARAAAAAGLSDPFIQNQNQYWVRLPDSLPEQKKAQGRTEPAKLIEWSGTAYSLPELAVALKLKPEKAPTATQGYTGSRKFDEASAFADPVFGWLRSRGRVKESNMRMFDSRGFVDVICPNAAAHTDQSRPWARYVPPNQSSPVGFTCHHAHCKQLRLADLRKSVEAAGGPTEAEALAYATKVRQLDETARERASQVVKRFSVTAEVIDPDTETDFAVGYCYQGCEPTQWINKPLHDAIRNAFYDGAEDWHESLSDEDIMLTVFDYLELNDKPIPPHLSRFKDVVNAAADADALDSAIDFTSEYADIRLPTEALPPRFRFIVEDVVNNAGFDPAIVFIAHAVTVAGLIGARGRLELSPNWHIKPIIWGGIIGVSGANKTAPINQALQGLVERDKATQQAYALEVAKAVAKCSNDRERKAARESVKMGRRFYVDDVTIQKLGDLLVGQDDGIAAVRDELSGWIADMEGQSQKAARAAWLKLWDGGSKPIDRVVRGSSTVDVYAAHLIGGLQPRMLAHLTKRVDLTSDGLLQRFLFVRPAKVTKVRSLRDSRPLDDAFKRQSIVLASPRLSGAVWTAEEAVTDLMDAYRQRMLEMSQNELFDEGYREWLSKCPSQLGRLMIVMQAIEEDGRTKETVVRLSTAEAALHLMREYFEVVAGIIFDSITGQEEREDTKKIARYLLRLESAGKLTISTSDMARSGPKPLKGKSAEDIRAKVSRFVAGGWLVVTDEQSKFSMKATQFTITEGLSERFQKETDEAQRVYREVTAKFRV